MQAPASATDTGVISFRELIDFIAHVADCYPTDVTQFPEDLIRLLNLHHGHLEPELREKVVGSLVLLRRKDIINSPRYSPIHCFEDYPANAIGLGSSRPCSHF